MAEHVLIRTAFERNAELLRLRPGIGQKTYITRVRVRDGLTCDIEEGPWKLTADLSCQCGGSAAGPTPGTLGRAALGSCLAMSYVMWAARLDVPLDQVAVDIEADTDVRGMYGVSDAAAGYTEVRYLVSITSPASEADILRVLDIAEAHSPYMDVFRHAQTLRRQVRLLAAEE